MYQNEIKEEALEAIQSATPSKLSYSIFEKADFEPLTFLPEDDDFDATAIARDILIKRCNADIIKISKSINYMLQLGENLLQSLALEQLRSGQRKSVSISDGRALYLLHHYFDLKTLSIKNLKWYEVFATLVLMQTAEIRKIFTKKYDDDDLSQAMKEHSQLSVPNYRQEIIDSVARAECLFDKKFASSAIAKSGGNSKAKNMKPLKTAVIKLYLADYAHLNNKKAGEEISKRLIEEDDKLRFLSYSDEKNLQFSKWIGLFRKGELQIPVEF